MNAQLPPGPESLISNRNPIDLLADLASEYGDFVRYSTPYGPTVFVNDPPSVRRILFDREGFPRSNVLHVAIGEGLLATEGELWHTQRRRYQPKFHPKALETYAADMAQEAMVTVEEWEEKAAAGTPINLNDEMLQYSLRVSSKVFFGDRVDSGEANRALGRVASQIVVSLGHMGNTLPLAYSPEYNRQHRIALGLLERVIGEFIERRRSRPEGPDLLGTLLYMRGEDGGPAMDGKQLRDEVATILLGGHETTSVSLTWSLWELCTRPDLVEAMCEGEWREVLAGRDPGWEDLMRMPRTQALVREILRLRPPVWALVRKVAQTTEMQGYTIREGDHMLVSPFLVHRHRDNWEDPEELKPERFLAEIPKDQLRATYIPFGAGPHTCIGQHVANMELMIALPVWLRRFRLVPEDPSPPHHEPLITLRPGRPLIARLEKRPA